MKFRKFDISRDYFALEFPRYYVCIHLETKIENGSSCYFYDFKDYDFYLVLLEYFGDLEISSLKFCMDYVYVCFNLDNDLFIEF